MGIGTPAQQKLAKKFFDPFFNWEDDEKLRGWLRQQVPDELEQFLNWFDFSTRRDREMLGRQELRKLHAVMNEGPQAKPPEMLALKSGLWGMSVDLKEIVRRARNWLRGGKR
jgi:hypothetical protein